MTFNGKFPGSAQAVTSAVEVAWAYTREGWKFVQDQIRRQNYAGEPWVLGGYAPQGQDKAATEKGILDLYTADYIEQWRRVLRGSNVNRYNGAQDAARKLDLLTSNNAPLLALFWWTSYHTAVEELPGVKDKFKAVQVVAPFSTNQQYILPSNAGYNTALIALKQSVDRVAGREPDAERAMRDSAQAATATTKQVTATFPPDPEGRVDQRSEELLLQPIRYLEGFVGADLRSAGNSFCIAFNGLTNKFPFNPDVQPEVTLAELNDILQPNTGRMWTFYNNSLKSALTCQAGQCTPTGSPPLSASFVRFFGELVRFSRALYGDAGSEPNYRYTLQPQPNQRVEGFTVTINGETAQLRPGTPRPFVWPGGGARGFRLALRLPGGSELPGPEFDGLWAVFRFFADADRTTPSGTGAVFEWRLRQGRSAQSSLNYSFLVGTGGGPAVFSKDFLSTLKCVGPLAR
jgi:type VI protein secretion system component VasK